jgi:hypothetical protein
MLSRPLGGLTQSDDPDRPRKQRHRNVTRVPLPQHPARQLRGIRLAAARPPDPGRSESLLCSVA